MFAATTATIAARAKELGRKHHQSGIVKVIILALNEWGLLGFARHCMAKLADKANAAPKK
jgi:hypothetical protein